MAEKKKVRIGLGTFDLIKGIAIAIVVFSHSVSRYTLDDFGLLAPVYYFMYIMGMGFMPMFFIISGYGFKDKPVGKTLKKTFSELLIPYLLVIPLSIGFYIVMHLWKNDMPFILENTGRSIVSFLLCTETAGPMWFFIALFIASNLLNLILKCKKTLLQILLVTACIIFGFFVMHSDFKYFQVIQGFTAVGFCYAGHIMKEKKILERSIYSPWPYLILLPVCLAQTVAVLLSINGQGNSPLLFDMSTGDYSVYAFFAAGCTGVLMMLLGVLCSKMEWKCMEWVSELGVYSYWILLVHTIEYNAFPWHQLFVENDSVYAAFFIEMGLKVLFIILGCSIMKKITQLKYKNKMKKAGKKRMNLSAAQ